MILLDCDEFLDHVAGNKDSPFPVTGHPQPHGSALRARGATFKECDDPDPQGDRDRGNPRLPFAQSRVAHLVERYTMVRVRDTGCASPIQPARVAILRLEKADTSPVETESAACALKRRVVALVTYGCPDDALRFHAPETPIALLRS